MCDVKLLTSVLKWLKLNINSFLYVKLRTFLQTIFVFYNILQQDHMYYAKLSSFQSSRKVPYFRKQTYLGYRVEQVGRVCMHDDQCTGRLWWTYRRWRVRPVENLGIKWWGRGRTAYQRAGQKGVLWSKGRWCSQSGSSS